jgi:HSP20 family protein
MALLPFTTTPWPTLIDEPTSMLGWNRTAPVPTLCRCDLYETDAEFVIDAEVPGVAKEKVRVEMEQDNVLRISGEASQQRERGGQGQTYYTSERSFGRFTRSFRLPSYVDIEKISAEHSHGILHVTIPKKRQSGRETRRIDVV